jgi:RNA ligase (TIGR02306 family)
MSTHKVEVVRVRPEKHPDADRLSLVKVHGWQVIVGKDEFKEGQLGVYLAPDYVVPLEPSEVARSVIRDSTLAMLAKNCKVVDGRAPCREGYVRGYRIKVKKFRGEWSQGLLLQAPEGVKEGDDLMSLLDIGYYEPPLDMMTGGETEEKPPEISAPKFDVESLFQYNTALEPGTGVVVSEKIHGAQARFLFEGTRFFCGSKNEWKKEHAASLWWRALNETKGLKEWLQKHPEKVIYGEIYGSGVQDLAYGLKNRDIRLCIFDIWDKDHFLPYDEAKSLAETLPWVPELYRGPYSESILKPLIDGESQLHQANHLREGIVIRTLDELKDPNLGRVILKVVSNAYLERG